MEGVNLRSIGEWDESKWAYNPVKQQMVKQFVWKCRATSAIGEQGVTLRYQAIARALPNRMEDLTYVAEQERAAIAIIEAMVTKTVQGTAYLARPDMQTDLNRAVINEVDGWAQRRAFPEDYRHVLSMKISNVLAQHELYMTMLVTVQAFEDEEHPEWGLAFTVQPLAPTVVIAE